MRHRFHHQTSSSRRFCVFARSVRLCFVQLHTLQKLAQSCLCCQTSLCVGKSRILCFFLFLFEQVNLLRRGDAAICGGQHLPQVVHHHQILPEDVEQRERDAHLHLPRCFHCGRSSRLELDLRRDHCDPLSGIQSAGSVGPNTVTELFLFVLT